VGCGMSHTLSYLLLFSAQRYKKIPISANYSRISDWLRNRNTLEYIGVWEQMYNPNFNYGEFAIIKSNAGLNNFKISVKELVQRTNCIGILLNLIIFGCTAKDWEQMNPELAKKGYNLRDTATINQLVVLSNIEARNSELLKQHGLNQRERRAILHQIAKEQLAVLNTNNVEQKFRKLLGNDPKKLE
jgi:hypothetical protein